MTEQHEIEKLWPDWQKGFKEPPDHYPFSGYAPWGREMYRLQQYPGAKLERGQLANRNLEGVKGFRHGNGFGIKGTQIREHIRVRGETQQIRQAPQGKVHPDQVHRKTQITLRNPPTNGVPATPGAAGADDGDVPW